MLIQLDCCECIITQIIRMARELDAPETEQREFFHAALKLFQEKYRTVTPPEMATWYFELYSRFSKQSDPYREIKMRSTAIAAGLYPELEKICRTAENSFLTRLKLAISGNMIDYGVNPDFNLEQVEDFVREALELPCDHNAASQLEERIRRAGNILYILDNCGEAVLDRLLLETMSGKVTIAVRGGAIINDITRREVSDSGLAEFPLIDTGCSAPGAPLQLVSREFRTAMENADLVIAKGQGNFESLEGEFRARPIYFLFRAKCPVIQKYVNAVPGSMQIIGHNLNLQ